MLPEKLFRVVGIRPNGTRARVFGFNTLEEARKCANILLKHGGFADVQVKSSTSSEPSTN